MKKSSLIEDTLECCLAQITSKEQLLPLALTKAAQKCNLSLPEFELQRLTTSILKTEGNVLQIDLDPPCALGETEEEVQAAVQGIINELVDSVPEIEEYISNILSEAIPDALAKVAELISNRISEQALEHTLHLRSAQSERAQTVQRLWGSAIDQLDFLRHMVLEWGYVAIELRRGAYANRNTAFALNKLVARAYEVVGEIITLVRAGYADGGLARWRSLHEICVVALFLAKRSDRCAQMYLSHHLVEELRLLEFNKVSGIATHHERHVRSLRKQKAAMINKFGKNFANDYGWASVELGRAKTTFRDLESHVELEILRRGYQKANSTVHGGALATLTRVSLGPSGVDGTEAPPAYGCEVAIDYATASMSMLVAELCIETENADLLTMNMVVQDCAFKIREIIDQRKKTILGTTPRAKILIRKAERRKFRGRLN